VKQAVDIVDVVSQVVPLRRVGNRHLGLCPFHQEKTPSFHVDAENQLYYCFGCGSGGDVLSFVMRHRNSSFGEALEYLADRYHISLPEKEGVYGSGPMAETARKEREQLFKILRTAADFFYDQLHHSEAGKIAREYIQQRGLPVRVVEDERLGYAPARWDGLLQHLKRSGMDIELSITAGLVTKSSKDESKIYDRFRNRLIFPIANEQGQVIGFGGRSLSKEAQDEPKYLNSPESPVYHKGRTLYQMARAREACRQMRQVVLVEGYMDLLAFHTQGFYRVVATLGTALTSHQVRLLSRIADEVTLAYDGDEAGERAMLRALPLFLGEELPVSCIRFPDGMDPDDFLKDKGLEAFETLQGQRRDLGLYAISKVLDTWDGSTMGKTRVLAELKPVFDGVRQPVLRSDYLEKVSERLSLARDVIEEQFRHGKRETQRYSAPRRSASVARPKISQAQSLEESILRLMIKYPELIEEVKASGAVDYFQEPAVKAVAEVLLNVPYPPYGTFDAAAVYDMLNDSGQKELFTRLRMDPAEMDQPQIQIKDWVGALFEREIKQKRLNLNESLQKAEQEGNKTQVRYFMEQILHSARKRVRGTPENV
jgi:DNA primase